MSRRAKHLTGLALTVLVLVAMSRPAPAGQITSVSASGPGGKVSDLAITTAFNPNDAIQYEAKFTRSAPITISFTVNGSGQYFLGFPLAGVTNATGVAWPTFDISLVGVPAGSTFNGYSFNSQVYQGANYIPPFPNATTLQFFGPPGLSAGQSTTLGASFSISGAGSFQLTLSPPTTAVVPEPSTLTLAMIGTVALAGWASWRRTGRAKGQPSEPLT